MLDAVVVSTHSSFSADFSNGLVSSVLVCWLVCEKDPASFPFRLIPPRVGFQRLLEGALLRSPPPRLSSLRVSWDHGTLGSLNTSPASPSLGLFSLGKLVLLDEE